jgi:hypothetical protein
MHNRLVFGNRMMELAREADLIPPEQYAERQSDGQDGAWFKKLIGDISRQASWRWDGYLLMLEIVMIGLHMHLHL